MAKPLGRRRPGRVLAALLVALPLSGRGEDLAEAWAAAIAADRRFSAVRHITESARASLSAAEGARLPRLSLEGGYTALDSAPTNRVTISPFPTLDVPQSDDRYWSYQASVSLPLYTSGRISRGIDAARAGLDAQSADESRALADLKLEVAGAYLDVLRAQRAREVTERTTASLAAHAADVQTRFAKGLVARNQLLAAQVALADARQRTIRAQNRLDLAQAAYNRLLGRPLTAPVMLVEPEPRPHQEDVETLAARALERRPELKRVGQQSQALRHQSAAERAATLPQVEFSLGYLYQENPYVVEEGITAARLGLRWDLYDGGVVRQQAAATAERAAALAEEHADVATRISLQVREAWLDEQETEKRLPVAREAVDQAEEGLRVARARYREGLSTNTEVLDAETQRTVSYVNYYGAVYDAVLADLRVRHAVGEL